MSKEYIESHIFSPDDRVFFDANIWLSIYGPHTYTRRRSAIYQSAWKRIRETGVKVHVDALVMSEFINSYAQWEYNNQNKQVRQAYPKFKTFRGSTLFKPIAEDIANQAQKITAYAIRCGSTFEALDVQSLLAQYALGNSDFNDQVIVEVCRSNEFVLVTDDSDFRSVFDLLVVTANRSLLA